MLCELWVLPSQIDPVRPETCLICRLDVAGESIPSVVVTDYRLCVMVANMVFPEPGGPDINRYRRKCQRAVLVAVERS